MHVAYHRQLWEKKAKEVNDQEIVQSERSSHFENRDGKH